jgi:uncharacterized protein with NAD-binding domain and iron-sulfur cluster
MADGSGRSAKKVGRKKVAIFGAGIAGLTAAHELSDRGFEVHVFEKSDVRGGKARSLRVMGRQGTPGLPGEHGFHFFPGFYKHVPDSMKRIPVGDGANLRAVADNLVGCTRTLVARESPARDLDFPTRVRTFEDLLQLRKAIRGLGLPLPEIPYFMNRVRILATSCEERFDEEFENQSWWDFIGADKKLFGFSERSSVYKRYLAEVPIRFLVAMDPHKASARTVGRIGLRMWNDLLYPVSVTTQATNVMVDRVLNGPTNDAWIDPWVKCLVDGTRVMPSNASADANARVTEVTFERAELVGVDVQNGYVTGAILRKVRSEKAASSVSTISAEAIGNRARSRSAADPLGRVRTASHLEALGDLVAAVDERPSSIARHFPGLGDDSGTERQVHEGGAEAPADPFSCNADYYIFALPLTTMCELVDRTPSLRADPSLRNLPRLRPCLSWMTGIQFFLRRDVPIVRGHIILVDAPWALTLISQPQFWQDQRLGNSYVKGVFSVIISNWDARGDYCGKSARECDPDEIKNEIWSELKAHLNEAENVEKGDEFLRDSDLLDWYLSDSMQWDGAKWTNSEELLINMAGSLKNRPYARTSISNMFLAGEYVRTHTDLATTESANEAARRAVNEILEVEGFEQEDMCRIWPLELDLPKPLAIARDKAIAFDAARYTLERANNRKPGQASTPKKS